MRRFILLLALICVSSPTLAGEILRVLDGQIIRSLAVHPAEAGSALVFESRDGGKTWWTLNGGASLDPEASDVQVLVYGPNQSVLAGTWKHGLYRSRDGGETFAKHEGFPSPDVRDLKGAMNEPQVFSAATERDGLFRSLDGGAT